MINIDSIYCKLSGVFLCILMLVGCSNHQMTHTQNIDENKVGSEHAKAVLYIVFDRLDCDLEGTIDTAEVDDHFAQIWHPADLDQSMSLSRKEYQLVHAPVTRGIATALFKDADTDANGHIGAGEFRDHLQRMILTLDANGDFEVTRQEAGLKALAPPRPRENSSSTKEHHHHHE